MGCFGFMCLLRLCVGVYSNFGCLGFRVLGLLAVVCLCLIVSWLRVCVNVFTMCYGWLADGFDFWFIFLYLGCLMF